MEIKKQNERPQQAPTFLRTLVILSLITIIYGLLMRMLSISSGPISQKDLDEFLTNIMEGSSDKGLFKGGFFYGNSAGINSLYENGEFFWADTISKIINLVRYTNANFYMDQLINIGGYCIGLAGVIFMLRGRKLGFHLYIIYNLVMMVSIYASAPASEVPAFYLLSSAFVSLLFILLYSRNLKWMK